MGLLLSDNKFKGEQRLTHMYACVWLYAYACIVGYFMNFINKNIKIPFIFLKKMHKTYM